MANQNFTLQLDGEVSLGRFVTALDAWRQAIEELIEQVGTQHVIGVTISDLASGSALIAASVEFSSDRPALAFVRDYGQYARAVGGENVINISKRLTDSAQKLRLAAGMDAGTGIVIGSSDDDIVVSPELDELSQQKVASAPALRGSIEAFGSVSGRLQALSSRKSLTATVYDEFFDKGVRIYLTQDLHDSLGKLWDQLVTVDGFVRRNASDGRPLSISNVASIATRSHREQGERWKSARGVLKGVRPELSSEEHIRRARNG